MSRPLVLILVIIVILAGALVLLSSQSREVPTKPIEIDVTNEAGS